MHSRSSSNFTENSNIFSLEGRKLYSLFFLINFFVFFLALLIPVRAKSEGLLFVSVLNLLFILLVFSVSFFILKLKPVSISSAFTKRQEKNVRVNVVLCCGGSFLGLLMVAYDRVFIRGIDYFQGLRAARYEWLASDGGSFVSIIGNILIPLSYVGLFLLVVNPKLYKKSFIVIFVFLMLLVIFSHSALNGGRSNILLAIVIMLVAFSLRLEKVKFLLIFKALIFSFIISVPTFLYVSEIIKSSASMGDVDLGVLLVRAVDSLQGQFVESYSVQNASELELISIYISSYLVHGQWTAQTISNLDSLTGSYFLYPFSVILARLSIIEEPLDQGVFSDVGAFVSLPAAIYYDFGYMGLISCSLLLGVLFGVCLNFLRNRAAVTGFRLGFIVYISCIVLLSPILPGYGFSYLNFIIFSFVMVGFLNRFFFGKRYRLL